MLSLKANLRPMRDNLMILRSLNLTASAFRLIFRTCAIAHLLFRKLIYELFGQCSPQIYPELHQNNAGGFKIKVKLWRKQRFISVQPVQFASADASQHASP